jgi:5-methylcytosine-specific restriction endonuclease McrA
MTELHQKIHKLRSENNASYKTISATLGCSISTVSYALCGDQKIKAADRRKKRRDNPENVLALKLETFRGRNSIKSAPFKTEDVLRLIGKEPKCYLSGIPVDLSNRKSYQLDHVVPTSKGGSNDLTNLGVAATDVNKMKSDLSVDEFLGMCKKILDYNGYKVTK